MNNRKVYISGEIVPEADAKISIFDSAVLLGDTVINLLEHLTTNHSN